MLDNQEKEPTSEMLDLCSLSDTFPDLPVTMLSRTQYLDLFDKQLSEYNILFVPGEEGYGVTTTLAQYAKRHSMSCFSYFAKDLDMFLYDQDMIESSLSRQMFYYINAAKPETTITPQYSAVLMPALQSAKKYGDTLFFVLDGFDKIPTGKLSSVKKVFERLPWGQAKFILSGESDLYKDLIPNLNKLKSRDTNTILGFQDYEIEIYFKSICPKISQEQLGALISITGGIAVKMDIIAHKYKEKGNFDDYLNLNNTSIDDLYDVDFQNIVDQNLPDNEKLLALIAYSADKLGNDAIAEILDISEKQLERLVDNNKMFLKKENQLIQFKTDYAQKYIRKKLIGLKVQIETFLIDYYECHQERSLDFLPSLYWERNLKGKLIDYLKSDKVQNILERRKSQAALNEQCRYGFDACLNDVARFPDRYRFALYKSSSLEQELTELWDNEIEALLAIGNYKQAFELSNEIYIEEEKLKALAIIARHQHEHRGSIDESLMGTIKDICSRIDFKNIPDKSIELAKLLIHVDFTLSLDIIDKVALTEKGGNSDKIFSVLSMSIADDMARNTINESNYDLVAARISNNELKSLSYALKTLFVESSAGEVLEKAKDLPNISQKLFLLTNWIDENQKKEDVGKVVIYAVEQVIASSNEKVPKATNLAKICIALPYIDKDEVSSILKLLDSIDSTIKYPSKAYVKIQLRIIESISRFDKEAALDRLLSLYCNIDDIKNQNIQIECYALILKDYEKLGEKKLLEEKFMPIFELQKQINSKVDTLLKESAYHYKVLEGAIKILVCDFPSFIFDNISKLNTHERRNESYLLAVDEYIRQSKIEEIKWDYLKKLLDSIDYPVDDISRPIRRLVRKFFRNKDISEKYLFEYRKLNFYFDKIDNPTYLCEFLSVQYVLTYEIGDKDSCKIIFEKLVDVWEGLQDKRNQIDQGYLIAYIISDVSKEVATEILKKTIQYHDKYILSSSSSAYSFGLGLDLYQRTLGVLVRSGVYTEENIREFDLILAHLSSPLTSFVLWSQLCLEFYFSGTARDKFNLYVNEKILKPLESFRGARYLMERIYCFIGPSIYLYNSNLFVSKIRGLSKVAKDYCIYHTIRVIMQQYPYALDIKGNQESYELEYNDYLMLCDLLLLMEDDGAIFEIIDKICNSLKENIGRRISNEQRKDIINKLKEITNTKLPSREGIQHEGYKIACMISIEGIDGKRRKKGDWVDYVELMKKVPNVADKSFLYIHLSKFVSQRQEQEMYIQEGYNLSKSITSRYDKTQRMKWCLDSCKTNKQLYGVLIKDAYNDTIDDKNGSLADFNELIDSAQQYDESLANDLIDQLDRDPARLQYKTKLLEDLIKKRKIKDAVNDKEKVRILNQEEFRDYFKKQLAMLIAGKCTLWKDENLNNILPLIYRYPISYTMYAIIFILETLYLRKKINREDVDDMLIQLYQANIWNLKILLSLASGTKTKQERLNKTIIQSHQEENGLVRPGDRDKAISEIIRWYKSFGYGVLKIIDAYFHPKDLDILKRLFNINEKLQVRILTHRKNVKDLSDYQDYWNQISSDLTGGIFIYTVQWEDNASDGPLHDRWWILEDRQADYQGLRMTSLSNLGNKETEIGPMTSDEILHQEEVWDDYSCELPSIDGRMLKYERIRLKAT